MESSRAGIKPRLPESWASVPASSITSNSNIMEHRLVVSLLPNEVLSEMVTEEENKGRRSCWSRKAGLC